MMTTQEIIRKIESLGAFRAAPIRGDQVVLEASFRSQCAQNSCGAYGKYWVCPPACGEIEDLMACVRSYDQAILYQSVGSYEDSFDFEGMTAARHAHSALSRRIEKELGGLLPPERLHLSVGGCDLCAACSYPEGRPCRHPEEALLSLEACGVDVYQTAKAAGLSYNNGPNTVTYFGLILFRQAGKSPSEEPDTAEEGLGLSLDIGTTTLALSIHDLSTGETLRAYDRENPQRMIAADVMSRIRSALEGNGPFLRELVTGALRDLPRGIRKAVIVGNTAMLYFLLGKDPEALSHAPFKADDLFGRTEEILGIPSYLPPCMNAFVGADTTAAVLSSGMCRSTGTSLLIDIGTNGELALWKDGTLYVTSTAAGPAFEGAGISQGSPAKNGAIDKVWEEEGRIRVNVIGEGSEKSICGSGILDAVSVMLGLGVIDETGAMDSPSFSLTENVALTRKDIRAVQLAKGAVRAGIETLLKSSSTEPGEIQALYIAGAFGSHLCVESAVRIGLIPPVLADRTVILGNAALRGAEEMLLKPSSVREAEAIASRSKHVDLGGNPLFNDLFVENMLFQEAFSHALSDHTQ